MVRTPIIINRRTERKRGESRDYPLKDNGKAQPAASGKNSLVNLSKSRLAGKATEKV